MGRGSTSSASSHGYAPFRAWAAQTSASRSRPKAKPDAAVVAVAAQDVGEAVVAPAAADFDRARCGHDDQLEDHLRVEADPPAEAQVELDTAEVDSVRRQAVDQVAEVARPIGANDGQARARAGRATVARALQVGQRVDLARGRRPGPASRQWPRSHLRRSRSMISSTRAPAGDDRDQSPEQAVDAAVVGPGDRPRSARVGRSQPLARFEPARQAGRGPTPAPAIRPVGGGFAEHLDQGRRRPRRAGPVAAASPGSARRARAGSWRP